MDFLSVSKQKTAQTVALATDFAIVELADATWDGEEPIAPKDFALFRVGETAIVWTMCVSVIQDGVDSIVESVIVPIVH